MSDQELPTRPVHVRVRLEAEAEAVHTGRAVATKVIEADGDLFGLMVRPIAIEADGLNWVLIIVMIAMLSVIDGDPVGTVINTDAARVENRALIGNADATLAIAEAAAEAEVEADRGPRTATDETAAIHPIDTKGRDGAALTTDHIEQGTRAATDSGVLVGLLCETAVGRDAAQAMTDEVGVAA